MLNSESRMVFFSFYVYQDVISVIMALPHYKSWIMYQQVFFTPMEKELYHDTL